MNILAIDPGTTHSGWCLIDTETFKPLEFGKDNNAFVLKKIYEHKPCDVVIERLVSYGQRIGNEVLMTCEWVGRFTMYALDCESHVHFIRRIEEKRQICGTPTANDSMIRNALIAEFAKHDMKNGKGTKDSPDWFYGFKADVWQAYAIGVTWLKGDENG